jgi:hypothetical protein
MRNKLSGRDSEPPSYKSRSDGNDEIFWAAQTFSSPLPEEQSIAATSAAPRNVSATLLSMDSVSLHN